MAGLLKGVHAGVATIHLLAGEHTIGVPLKRQKEAVLAQTPTILITVRHKDQA
jgi:hypothetical protein